MAICGHYKRTKGAEVEKIGNWLSVMKGSEQNSYYYYYYYYLFQQVLRWLNYNYKFHQGNYIHYQQLLTL